jgi:predicted amidohydrolase YtcJ
MGMPLVARAQQPGATEVVPRGGRVLAMASTRVAEAVAVSGGRIAYVGSTGGVGPFIGPATEVIELRGRTLMPGIHDAHMHPGRVVHRAG